MVMPNLWTIYPRTGAQFFGMLFFAKLHPSPGGYVRKVWMDAGDVDFHAGPARRTSGGTERSYLLLPINEDGSVDIEGRHFRLLYDHEKFGDIPIGLRIDTSTGWHEERSQPGTTLERAMFALLRAAEDKGGG